MKNLLQIIVIFILGTMALQAKEVKINGVKMNATIIDVRTAQEFSAGHIDGAINIPVDQIEAGIHAVKGLGRDSQIVLYCRSGRRTAIAKNILEKQGFQKIFDGGGMESLVRNMTNCSAQAC